MASDFIIAAYVRNGFATVCRGSSAPDKTNETNSDFVQAIPSAVVATGFAFLAHRFVTHGGAGNSGQWEH